MSYVQRVLQPGEQVRHISSIHWIVYWPGVAVALLAVVAYWLSETRLLPGIWRYTAYALALVAVVLLIQQWFQWWVTEIAVTNRRVIYKKGLIRRQTNEMNMDKVESVQIDQSILGRMLDYGDRDDPWHRRRLRDAPHHRQPNRASKQHHRNDAQSLGLQAEADNGFAPAGTLVEFVVLIVAAWAGDVRFGSKADLGTNFPPLSGQQATSDLGQADVGQPPPPCPLCPRKRTPASIVADVGFVPSTDMAIPIR